MTNSQIPLQEDCDPTKPEEAALWASMYIPVAGRSPMVFPRMIGEHFSKHYTECGFVHVDYIRSLADENGMVHVDKLPKQKKKFRRPYRGQQNLFNGMGMFVPMDDEDPEPIRIQDPAAMTVHEREAQVERLRYLGYKINEPDPETPKASVGQAPPRFDPSQHSVKDVNAYLRGLDPKDFVEYRGVVMAELAGKARPGILKRHSMEGGAK